MRWYIFEDKGMRWMQLQQRQFLFRSIESTADYGEMSAFFKAEAHCVVGAVNIWSFESSKNSRGKQRNFQENKVFSLHVCVQQNMNTIKQGNCNSGEEGTKASLTTTSLYDKSASAKTDILIFCFLFVSTLDFEKYSNFNFPQGLIFFCCRLDLFCEFCFSAFYHCDYYAEGRSPARKKV